MTHEHDREHDFGPEFDYLWDPRSSAPVEPFAAELERRLAPLAGDLDELLDGLDEAGELDEPGAPESDLGVVLPLRSVSSVNPSPDPSPERAWPWLLAAVVLLGLAVGLLWRSHPANHPSLSGAAQVAGAGSPAARVRVGFAVLDGSRDAALIRSELRERHPALAGCALTLAPGESLRWRAELSPSGARVRESVADPASSPDATVACLHAALADWRPGAELDLDLTLSRPHPNPSPNPEESSP